MKKVCKYHCQKNMSQTKLQIYAEQKQNRRLTSYHKYYFFSHFSKVFGLICNLYLVKNEYDILEPKVWKWHPWKF